ncbi:MAG: CRISPR-associated helicase Cas3' [Bacillaceae bacterium]
MENLFLAKSADSLNTAETIEKHTQNLLTALALLKSLYPNIPHLNWELLKQACLYHDVGKANTKFQNKIFRVMNINDMLHDCLPYLDEIPHGYLSCAFIPFHQFDNIEDRKILAQAVYFHHKRPAVEPNALRQTIQQDLSQYYHELQKHLTFPIVEPNYRFSRYATPNRRIRKDSHEDIIRQFIMVKGLLNKIDHAASAGIPVEIENDGLSNHLNHYFANKLNAEPNELQKYMIENQDENNIIIASTGIGKTEGALYWVGNGKGFFTLPLRVSINSIYKRIYEQMNFQKVALLHSETESEYIKNDIFNIDYYEQTKQWSMPLTICTLDQILDFVFKQEGYEKKLAILAYSKLIIDEIQMYSPKMLACLLYALKEITEIGGKFTIMTATFAPFIDDLMKRLHIVAKKTATPFFKEVNGEVMIRHRMVVKNKGLSVDDILLNTVDEKILVIVNTVSKAQAIYDELTLTRKDVFLFHSRFIKNDRKTKEEAIIKMGKRSSKEKGIWITTQVVEASVDIDFDVLYTELSDLNGLFQRMGRVYRNRSLDHERINIYVYNGGKDYTSGISSDNKSVIDKDIFCLSKEALSPYTEPTIFTENIKMKLIEENYTTAKLEKTSYYLDIKRYLQLLDNIIEYEEIDSTLRNLRDIFNETIIPKSVYIENENEISDLLQEYNRTFKNNDCEQSRIDRGKLKDQLYGFTVDIPKYRIKLANQLNRFERNINLSHFISIPVIDYPYDHTKGLHYTSEEKLFDEDQFS